ncbi:MAG: type IV pilus assembly protein PilM, partial [Planctomycetales bacterium]|nr:type IV pilus assembly protein PilM [Planctomycetales bacterium]
MASVGAVWGIDIGQCALKALRCRLSDDGETLIAEAFDYIEYPKILTEPDANPEQLVRDAMKQFLANNAVRDAKVAISVPGQSGLARFIKLPPVEAKKIPDIVKYEAKQQIPFSLDDVIWDYQPLLGGLQDEGVALETEVGLFAMKRDQVFRALRPFRDAGIELDVVQLTPIAIYNAVGYGVLENVPRPEDYDPENPPKSVAVISMGTDTTDLVVTNGFRIWQRSIPIGGSHFTKQLTKEMKLTFAKAEHLKRNARQAEDPKAVFQAMRPVFNDFVQELQRSLGYFRSIDRRAQITQAVALGNAMLLPGLQPYIEKNLELPVQRVSEYRRLEGSSVVSTPKFQDNVLSFAVAYGLCLQGLSRSRLKTNLIPRELVTARLIRRKKPWALLAMTVFFVGLCFNYLFQWSRWRDAHEDNFAAEKNTVQAVSSESSTLKAKDDELIAEFEKLKKRGNEVVGGADARFLMLEL